jgi:hypothetical protein
VSDVQWFSANSYSEALAIVAKHRRPRQGGVICEHPLNWIGFQYSVSLYHKRRGIFYMTEDGNRRAMRADEFTPEAIALAAGMEAG